eukprot:718927-Rhodomonas_salina.2
MLYQEWSEAYKEAWAWYVSPILLRYAPTRPIGHAPHTVSSVLTERHLYKDIGDGPSQYADLDPDPLCYGAHAARSGARARPDCTREVCTAPCNALGKV